MARDGIERIMTAFKRPMFRKGGNVGTGIMTGIVDSPITILSVLMVIE